ncbi:c-type cytochrome [Parasphingorhabdus sp.]|uniref:c-type cytochrome n=1 Tax=Parasphingorhabdus sp. TaxID=2709688 RepID=UPI003C752536
MQAPTDANIAVAKAGQSADPGDAGQGQEFARAHCAACHNITAEPSSANDKGPGFQAIVNSRGLTGETLTSWLRDSHNYPDLMAFEIDAGDIDDLAAYMLTLKSADYQPPIQ